MDGLFHPFHLVETKKVILNTLGRIARSYESSVGKNFLLSSFMVFALEGSI